MNIIRACFVMILMNLAGAGFYVDGHRSHYDWSLFLGCVTANAVGYMIILIRKGPE